MKRTVLSFIAFTFTCFSIVSTSDHSQNMSQGWSVANSFAQGTSGEISFSTSNCPFIMIYRLLFVSHSLKITSFFLYDAL